MCETIGTGNEDLRAQVKTLQYEINALKQERDVAKIRHEKEVRDAQSQAEADFRRAQASESNKNAASHKYEALARELQDANDRAANQKHDLEKKLRTAQDRAKSLQDDVDEAQNETSSLQRQHEYRLREVETKHSKLQHTLDDLRHDLSTRDAALTTATQRLSQRDATVGELESELLRLKAQGGSSGEELATVRRELTEQVAYLRRLETTDREQTAELRRLRQTHRAVAIVEEEKRALEAKVRRMDDLERELGEATFQRRLLEQERQAWATFLQGEGGEEGAEFDSPEAVARALTEERLEKASLLDRLGSLQPELTEKEGMVQALESARAKLQAEVDKLKAAGEVAGGAGGESKSRSRTRLERQRAVQAKEIEYLREQLRTFEAEDATGDVQVDVDEQTRQRIASLEDLVANYRNEVQGLQTELAAREPDAAGESKSLKRPAPDDAEPSARVGELSRKNRKLQAEIATLAKNASVAAAELDATKARLTTLQETAKTRVLTLRANPTDDFTATKLSTITALRAENKALHEKLEGRQPQGKTVPAAYFDAANAEVAELQAAAAERDKSTLRLKQVWARKSLEFREAVASLLGWKMDFMPNGRFRMTSLFYPSTAEDGEEEDGGSGNSIIFNGDTGIMKISGGADSPFGREIRPLIRFWVEERKEIPAFLAACTLEFYERTTRAQRM